VGAPYGVSTEGFAFSALVSVTFTLASDPRESGPVIRPAWSKRLSVYGLIIELPYDDSFYVFSANGAPSGLEVVSGVLTPGTGGLTSVASASQGSPGSGMKYQVHYHRQARQ
jgi:hypothetical protein